MNNHYSILIQWSDEDQAFLVHLPDFPSQHFVTHGDTYQEALKNGLEVIEILKETYLEDGICLPIPKLDMKPLANVA
ncbi:MAG: type II toxin-antitoxin system HicB family antitoxin [Alkalinema sp. CAN_BIN05]|nr:type II toxin-antitoxin system HicB family antitoxin [Alkalinema sp. CAN_BIN05]